MVAGLAGLVHSSPDQADRIWALARDTGLCFWARHLTLKLPLSTQVYKWVTVNLIFGGNPLKDELSVQGGVETLPVASLYRDWNKLRPDGPPGS